MLIVSIVAIAGLLKILAAGGGSLMTVSQDSVLGDCLLRDSSMSVAEQTSHG
jgi:hypothetical protein